MNALHYKAAYWVGQGVFDRLSSFSDFESRVNGIFEEKDRGDVNGGAKLVQWAA